MRPIATIKELKDLVAGSIVAGVDPDGEPHLPLLGQDDWEAWRVCLNVDLGECGCNAGAIGVWTALVLISVAVLSFPSWCIGHLLTAVGGGFLFLLASGAAGKGTGIALAHGRYRRNFRRLVRLGDGEDRVYRGAASSRYERRRFGYTTSFRNQDL